MIIQLAGKVKFPITLDSSVWIFDDRKVIFTDAFSKNNQTEQDQKEADANKYNEMYSLEVYQQKIKPPVNQNLTRVEKEEILTNTYVMPIKPFIKNAEVESDASFAVVHTDQGDIDVPVEEFINSLFLFAVEGKPVQEKGPVHLYFADGSNMDTPIKGFKKITFK